MHPYIIEKLAASRIQDLLSQAERHPRLAQAHRTEGAIGRLGDHRKAHIVALVSRSIHAAIHALVRGGDELAYCESMTGPTDIGTAMERERRNQMSTAQDTPTKAGLQTLGPLGVAATGRAVRERSTSSQ
jgi:hypothetical protein